MTSPSNEKAGYLDDVPRPVIRPPRQFGLVWLIPMVAALVGGWLAIKALSESGPTIEIAFKSASGLESGKTKIKYKDVEIGKVQSIHLSADLSRVTMTAAMVKEVEDYLTENTRFWVVRARVAAGQVSGLETLLSGAYIAMDPGQPGEASRAFIGLEEPPAVTMDTPGTYFNLRAQKLGSLDINSPVYYRQLKVGQVVSYEMTPDGSAVNIRIFINAPHDQRVHQNTRFWDAGGLDVTMDTEGLKINTESILSLLIGGIAFETPMNLMPGEKAKKDQTFPLYASRDQTEEPIYTQKSYFIAYFDESVRGLNKGAPVEFRGIKIGQVMDVQLEFMEEKMAFRIPVLMAIEPERIATRGELKTDRSVLVGKLVEKGLRAQLRTASLLTGQLYVNLSTFPKAPARKLAHAGQYPVIPTIPGATEEITASIARFTNELEKVPVAQIGRDLSATMNRLNKLVSAAEAQQVVENLGKSLDQLQRFSASLNNHAAPQMNAALDQLEQVLAQTKQTLAAAEHMVEGSGPMTYNLQEMTTELTKAARAIAVLADYLQRHPESIVFGKGAPTP